VLPGQPQPASTKNSVHSRQDIFFISLTGLTGFQGLKPDNVLLFNCTTVKPDVNIAMEPLENRIAVM